MVAIAYSTEFMGSASRGVSPEADYILRESNPPFQRLESFGRGSLFSDLDQLECEFSQPGWDGDAAEPIDLDSLSIAAALARSLPIGIPSPIVGVEPDGQVTLEWYASPTRVLSVSADPRGELHYAALLGAEKQYGTLPFLGDVPRSILAIVRRVSVP